MLIYIIVIIIVIYALYMERRELGCPPNFFGTNCDNQLGTALRGTKPSPEDDTTTVFSKMRKASLFSNKWVTWRIALITSFFSAIFIFYTLQNRLATEKELFVGMAVITGLVYYILNFYQYHLMNFAAANVGDGVDIISKRMSASGAVD